jgi:hypothetical protein
MTYYERNKEKVKEYYEKNKDKIKEHYQKNKHKFSVYNRNYWFLNKWKYDDRYEDYFVKKTLINVDINEIIQKQEKNKDGFIIRF